MIVLIAIFIIVLTCFISLSFASITTDYNVIGYLKKMLGNNLENKKKQLQINKYSSYVSVKLSMKDKIVINLLQKSNINKYIPFFSFTTLIVVEILVFSIVLYKSLVVVHFLPTAICIAFAASLLPFVLLDLLSKYNSEKIRHKLAEFISILNRWCAVKEDIMYAFEKSLDSGIDTTLKVYVRDMLIQINGGISQLQALSMLDKKVDNSQFHDFMINIKQNIRFRGDIKLLLTNMETQFYKMEEEYNRRNISTYKDRLILYGIMVVVLLAGFGLFRLNPKAYEFYMFTLLGKILLTVFCFIYTIGAYIAFNLTKFDY